LSSDTSIKIKSFLSFLRSSVPPSASALSISLWPTCSRRVFSLAALVKSGGVPQQHRAAAAAYMAVITDLGVALQEKINLGRGKGRPLAPGSVDQLVDAANTFAGFALIRCANERLMRGRESALAELSERACACGACARACESALAERSERACACGACARACARASERERERERRQRNNI
jgi:hypothetical protein